jgi:hypothetical protein
MRGASVPNRFESLLPGQLGFFYFLTGSGCAAACIADTTSSANLTASYLSDALANLLEAVISLASGAVHATCVWDEEPGQYRWTFDRVGAAIHLRITAFDFPYDPDGNETLEEGLEFPVFETAIEFRELERSVANAAKEVLDYYGELQYAQMWVMYPFPTALLERLQSLIAAADA